MRTIRNHQRGATLTGMLMMAALVGFIAFVGVKLVPIYLENFGVASSLKSLSEESTRGLGSGEIRNRLMKRLEVNNVQSVRPENVQIRPVGGTQVVSVNYEVRTRFFGNLYLVLAFDESVVLTGN